MRLTETMRVAIADAIIKDLPPARDFDGEAGEILRAAALKRIPKELHEWVAKRPDLFAKNYAVTPGCLSNPQVVMSDQDGRRDLIEKDAKLASKLTELAEAKNAHQVQIRSLYDKVKTALLAFNTVKQAKEALPEFAKYFPADEQAANRSLPAVRGTVEALQAAGWPSKRKARAK